MLRDIDAVIFDLDGVVTRTAAKKDAMFTEALRAHGATRVVCDLAELEAAA